MLGVLLAAALLPSITAELPKEFREADKPMVRVAYVRGPSGRYYVSAIRPLFDVTTAGGVSTVAGGGGGASTSGTNTWTGTQNFVDTSFFIVDDGDQTKKATFQVSGITTGTTRTYTLQNGNGTIPIVENAQTWSGLNSFPAVRIGLNNSDLYGKLEWNTTQTPDSNLFLTGSTSNAWVFAEAADNTFDFAHAAATDPTLFIHSHNQSTTQWLGLYNDGTYGYVDSGTNGGVLVRAAGTGYLNVNANDNSLRINSAAQIGWTNSFPGTANDTLLTREAAATIQMGLDVNGAATAQTLKAHDGITGSNIAGANLTLASGRGTGNAAASSVHIQTPSMLATGTTAQTLVDRFVACESKTLSNTTATLTNIATVSVPSNSGGAARITVSVRCDDGTNFDSDLVTSYAAFVNKAGTLTIGTAVTTGTAAANNSGSCTVAPTFTAGTNSVDINVTPVITTITPTTTTAAVNIENFGTGSVTCK